MHIYSPINKRPADRTLLPPELLDLVAAMTIQLLPPSDMEMVFTTAKLEKLLSDATTLLGLDVVYDAATFKSLNLEDFTQEDFESNDNLLKQEVKLNDIIEHHLQPLRLKGLPADGIRSTFSGCSDVENVIDILEAGSRRYMNDDFTENGGREVSVGGSYRKMRPICNDNFKQLAKEGKALVFSKDALFESGEMSKLHISRSEWATKVGKVKGRTCHNASYSSKNFQSYNESINYPAHDSAYPPTELCTIEDIAEMACNMRTQYPSLQLSGAVIDVCSAYQQTSQSTATALLTATIATVTIAGRTILLIVIYLVGMFGCSRAGNVYCICANALDERHNLNQEVRRSHTYIDDALLICPTIMMQASIDDYCTGVLALFGEGSVNYEKVHSWPNELIGIGWHVDFEQWTVRPKDRGIAKMLKALFEKIPPHAKSVRVDHLEHLTGLLVWYARGIPSGQSFVSSLYACKSKFANKQIRLSSSARRDLNWWRALVLIASVRPHAIAASISSLRREKVCTRSLVTDASLLFGGGAHMSLSRGGADIPGLSGDAIRWTRQEKIAFDDMGVSINVLEYFTAIYYIMLWSEHCENQVIHIECDNTAAVSWILKSRAGRSKYADALTKIFSLFCLKFNITVICTHIRGIDNTIADFRSRDLLYFTQDADEAVANGPLLESSNKTEFCRRLLMTCVTRPESLHGPRLLTVLTQLHACHGQNSA